MFWLLSVALILGSTAYGAPFLDARMIKEGELLDAYDYIVVGAGTAGTVIANRLTETPSVSVLVIEAGQLDAGEDFIHIPRQAGRAMGTAYDWKYTTVPMSSVNNRVINIPAGKVVGGGTVLNGMALDIGAASDYDAWEDLGNTGWSFGTLFPYFKKIETFTPPDAAFAAKHNLTWDMSAHGTSGPVYASYPRYLPVTLNWFFRGLAAMGVPLEKEGSGGRAVNAFFAPNALHPTNMSRSYARPAYFDPAVKRSNFHVLYNSQVTKLVGSGSPAKFTGVQYQTAKDQPVVTVNVNKEIILSAGAIGSPKLLELSGIGPSSLLQKFNIPVLVDLPGVGSNYQDHPYASMSAMLGYNPPDPEASGNAELQYRQNRTGPWTVAGPCSFGFLPLNKVVDTSVTQQRLNTLTQQSPSQYLRAGTHQTVIDGFAKQKEVLIKRFNTDLMAVTEFIGGGGGMAVSPQHQLSRGFVEISTADPFVQPTIDFRYGANPIDLDFFADAVKFTRRFWNTAPMQELRPRESSPGASVTSDEQLRNWAKTSMSTMFHSCCTAPMQPLNLGGVVDTNAVVYGTSNLRVVDASIIPLIPATHIQKTIYASAEKIADAIKAAA